MKKAILLFTLLMPIFAWAQNNPTLEQKMAQMLMVGFRGTEITQQSPVAQWIRDYQIGGIILFDYDVPSKSRPRNIVSKQQLKTLIGNLQSYSTTKLFIAIDEEGGNVSRLKPEYGFTRTVTPKYLGTIDKEDTTRFYAAQIARKCREVGINVNFAPAVDVDVNPKCPVIGKLNRSFSADAEVVARNARWFVEEHNKQGVLCSLKHFPGHGSSVSDTHLGLADVTDTWQDKELKPYQKLLSEVQPVVVMTAHIFNRKFDSQYPATLSAKILAKLRNDLHFNGLIFSDDMMMNAISKSYGLEEAIQLAINAGVDVLIFSNNIDVYNADIVKDALAAMKKLVASGKITEERINQSYQRIMKAKCPSGN